MLEKEIKKLNEEKNIISERLSAANLEYTEIEKLSTRFETIAKEIDQKEMRWLELSDLM
jgi:ATP-binding cassette subfamily F protein uup